MPETGVFDHGGGSSLTRLVAVAMAGLGAWVSPQAVNTTCGKERQERNDRDEIGRQTEAGPTEQTDRADRQTGRQAGPTGQADPKPPYRPGRSP